MSAGGPRGRTTRRSLARLHADALLLHGSEEGATAGRTPDSAKVAAFDQPAGARIPRMQHEGSLLVGGCWQWIKSSHPSHYEV